MASGRPIAEDLAPRFKVQLTAAQAQWLDQQPGSRSDTLRTLVDRAMHQPPEALIRSSRS